MNCKRFYKFLFLILICLIAFQPLQAMFVQEKVRPSSNAINRLSYIILKTIANTGNKVEKQNFSTILEKFKELDKFKNLFQIAKNDFIKNICFLILQSLPLTIIYFFTMGFTYILIKPKAQMNPFVFRFKNKTYQQQLFILTECYKITKDFIKSYFNYNLSGNKEVQDSLDQFRNNPNYKINLFNGIKSSVAFFIIYSGFIGLDIYLTKKFINNTSNIYKLWSEKRQLYNNFNKTYSEILNLINS